SVPVYLAVCVLGVSGWLPMKVLWIQLPVLERSSPEGDRLPLFFLLLMEVCSVATMAYLLARRCCRPRLSEVPVIYSGLALSLASLVLLGCFWEHSTPIKGQPHSFVLFLASFLAALVASVATVTYIPFAARLLPQYMTAMLLGESLSSLVPHLMFLVQGAGRKPRCLLTMSANDSLAFNPDNFAASQMRSTTLPPDLPLQLRFSVGAYFFIHAGIVGLSAFCFVALRWHRRCQLEYRQPPTRLYHQQNCEPRPNAASPLHQVPQVQLDVPEHSEQRQIAADSAYVKPNSFRVLLTILLWTATILAGPLSSLHSHACYPTGNTSFLMGAIMADAAAVMACLVAARCLTSGRSQVTIVIALTCLGSILLTYFVALITFSTETESHNSPLFGNAGELLVTVAWIAVVGLFSFAKMSIGVESSASSPEAVMWYSCFLRISVVLGALCVLNEVSISRLYKSVQECNNE
ncbi:hypothetical protein CAPTEDRAFT_73789, partial [Capitella teleta]